MCIRDSPHGARVGVILDWSTKWYAGKKDFSNNLIEDYNLRKMLKEKLAMASISRIDIQRTGSKVHVSVYTCLLYTSESCESAGGGVSGAAETGNGRDARKERPAAMAPATGQCVRLSLIHI